MKEKLRPHYWDIMNGVLGQLATECQADGIAVQQVRPIAPSLEDLFIARIRAAQTSSGDEVTP